MEEVFEALASPEWWLSVAVAGIVGIYAARLLDRLSAPFLARFSRRLRDRREERIVKRETYVSNLAANEHLRTIAVIYVRGLQVLSLMMFVVAVLVSVTHVIVIVSVGPELPIVLRIGLSSAPALLMFFGFILIQRTSRNSDLIIEALWRCSGVKTPSTQQDVSPPD